jgi:hypothetical protein
VSFVNKNVSGLQKCVKGIGNKENIALSERA